MGGVVKGDGALVIEGAAGLAEAGDRDISFLANAKYTHFLKTSKAAAVIVPPDVDTGGRPAIAVKNPLYGWARVLEILGAERTRHPAGIHPTAVIAPTAVLGKNVSVGARAVIEDEAVIGDNAVIYPGVFIGWRTRVGADALIYSNVTIRERVTVGDRCIFQPGVVIGSDGFGFTVEGGRHYKVPQVGTVEIGDDVEIQANTTIDRAAVGVTKIGRGTKIDNLVQVAHNAEIGEHGLVVALTGIAGSTKIGKYVTIAAQCGIAGHLTIGDGAVLAAKSGVSHDIKPKEVVWGTPAHPIKDEIKVIAAARKLPALLDEWKQIKKRMGIGS
jgi:UDP-3-O-[3-hydroxymyristoyl] glucosamine N-acyltransferase